MVIKKIELIVCIALVIFLIGMTFSSKAVTQSLEFIPNANTESLKEGDEVTIFLKISDINMGVDGINTFGGKLIYDETIFEKVKQSNFSPKNNWSIAYNDEETAKKGTFLATNMKGTKDNQTIGSVTLKVKSNINSATSTSIKFTELSSVGENTVELGDKTVTFNVIKSNAGDNTGNNPGDNTGNNPGDNTGNNPGDNTGNNPGDNTGNNPGDNTGNNPGDNTGNNPGDNTGNNPGDNTGDNPGDNTGDNPGDNTGDNPGDNTGNNPGDNTGNNPGDNTGNNPGDNTGENPEDNTGNNPGDNSGNNGNSNIGNNGGANNKINSSKLPKTGKESTMLVISSAILIIISTFTYIKLKEMNGV